MLFSLVLSSYATAALPTQLSPYPWEVVQPVNRDVYSITAQPGLIGPNSDIVASPIGNAILHYNITSNSSIIYDNLPTTITTVYSIPGSTLAYAAGSPISQMDNSFGIVYKIDFSAANPTWIVVTLPFALKYAVRDIHGTSDNDLWFTSGAGGVEQGTGALLHFDGVNWSKRLTGGETVIAVFARADGVWVSMGDGRLLHSTDGFKDENKIQVVISKRRNYGIGPFWGSSTPGSPLYYLSTDFYLGSLERISNTNCTPGRKPFCFFGNCVKPCQVVEKLYQLPSADNFDSLITLVGGIPGTTTDMVFTAGGGGYGGFWNGQNMFKDTTMIPSGDGQSTYFKLFVKDNYIYAVSTAGFIAKKLLF